MVTITGGELVVRTLLAANVRHVFGLHGAHLETIFQSLARHGIPIIDTRHEVAAGHAAEGYARATRGLGVAMVTAGPGFTNVITSLANACLDRTGSGCRSVRRWRTRRGRCSVSWGMAPSGSPSQSSTRWSATACRSSWWS